MLGNTVVLPERDTDVRAAEVQLLSGPAKVTGASTKQK
jgi:hypothetical protein